MNAGLNSGPFSVPEIQAAFVQNFLGLARMDHAARASGKRHALGDARCAQTAQLAASGETHYGWIIHTSGVVHVAASNVWLSSSSKFDRLTSWTLSAAKSISSTNTANSVFDV